MEINTDVPGYLKNSLKLNLHDIIYLKLMKKYGLQDGLPSHPSSMLKSVFTLVRQIDACFLPGQVSLELGEAFEPCGFESFGLCLILRLLSSGDS